MSFSTASGNSQGVDPRITTVQARRNASVAAIQPALPTLPAELPRNVMSLPEKLLEPKEVEITEMTLRGLLGALARGSLTAVEVTRAFLRRAALAQSLVNCCTELLPESALARAEYLDRYLAENKKPAGAMHGLPISVKEHVTMTRWEANFGFVGRVGTIANTDGALLKALYDAGAIFHVRATQPQSLLHLETSSVLYGVTVNPYNRLLTPGGSSGGEGALLALRGSLLGVGSDTGGSIRVPAGHSGVYGLRPTSNRVTLAGLQGIVGGREQIPSVVGPMSRDLDGLDLWMQTVAGSAAAKTDPSLPPLGWRADVDWLKSGQGRRKLKVGVMWDDGVVSPQPPVRRALREVIEKLRAQENVEVLEWTPYKHDWAVQIWHHLLFSDNAAVMKKILSDANEEPRPLTKWILYENPAVAVRTCEELWDWTLKRDIYRAELAALWSETGNGSEEEAMDVILSPLAPTPPCVLDQSTYFNYVGPWNVVDYPALAFPVTTVNSTLDPVDVGFQPKNEQDMLNHRNYDPSVYEGAPISLQLIARRWQDEKLLQAMHFIQDRIGEAKLG